MSVLVKVVDEDACIETRTCSASSSNLRLVPETGAGVWAGVWAGAGAGAAAAAGAGAGAGLDETA